jgi:hypothetical protein
MVVALAGAVAADAVVVGAVVAGTVVVGSVVPGLEMAVNDAVSTVVGAGVWFADVLSPSLPHAERNETATSTADTREDRRCVGTLDSIRRCNRAHERPRASSAERPFLPERPDGPRVARSVPGCRSLRQPQGMAAQMRSGMQSFD